MESNNSVSKVKKSISILKILIFTYYITIYFKEIYPILEEKIPLDIAELF